jgi:hypothetical protein
LKAITLINSISYILNEDKFSKYTARQVYEELGEEGFIDYLESICTKIIKNLNTETNIKNVKPEVFLTAIRYTAKTGSLKEIIEITYSPAINLGGIFIDYTLNKAPVAVKIGWNAVNISSSLKTQINYVYNRGEAKRNSLLTLKIPESDYPKYSVTNLILGLKFEKINDYLVNCLTGAMKSEYKPILNSKIDLSKQVTSFKRSAGKFSARYSDTQKISKDLLIQESITFAYSISKGNIYIFPRFDYMFWFTTTLLGTGKRQFPSSPYLSRDLNSSIPNTEEVMKEALKYLFLNSQFLQAKEKFQEVFKLI